MREIGKFCRIYCHDNHKKWAELLPHIERWMNHTVASARGYTPNELMFGTERYNILRKLVPNLRDVDRETDSLEKKIAKAYEVMRNKATLRETTEKGQYHLAA